MPLKIPEQEKPPVSGVRLSEPQHHGSSKTPAYSPCVRLREPAVGRGPAVRGPHLGSHPCVDFAPGRELNGNSLVNVRRFHGMKAFLGFSLLCAVTGPVLCGDLPRASRQFVEKHCLECHDADTKKGGLDLTALKFDPANSTNFSKWVRVHDGVSNGEMPPKRKPRPDSVEAEAFTGSLASSLTEVEAAFAAKEGRAPQRRLNRYEYEHALRDLL